MPTIKIPFPIHEGLEVKNATIDLENGYTVVEYGEKENRYILVPDNIGIYKWVGFGSYEDGDKLHIGFNNNTQSLGYSSKNKGSFYVVYPVFGDWKKIKCKLTPCKRENLKAGDTAFWTYESEIKIDELIDITSYCKIINEKDAICIEHNLTCICTDDKDIFWYKVEPIQ